MTSSTDVNADHPSSVAELFALYESQGHRSYGEDVTALEHALQCAALAFNDGAERNLVAAALFHDVGWLLAAEVEDDDIASVSDDHAALGARILSPLFGPDVAQPVALHVMAKRWRCTIEPEYFDELSEASQITFIAQGGPLNTDERSRFEAHPGFAAAMALRSWDDRAKIPDLHVPTLEYYRPMAEEIAAHRDRSHPTPR
jgi:gamma-butyrobetaine dioxygenase